MFGFVVRRSNRGTETANLEPLNQTSNPEPRTGMDISHLRQQFDAELASASSEAAVRALRDKYLARKGGVASNLLRDVASAPAGERPALGKLANELKQYIDTQLTE